MAEQALKCEGLTHRFGGIRLGSDTGVVCHCGSVMVSLLKRDDRIRVNMSVAVLRRGGSIEFADGLAMEWGVRD